MVEVHDNAPQVLIVESNIAQRRKLVDAIIDTGLTRNIQEAHSVAEGQELLVNDQYEICFVGSGLSEATQRTFIASMAEDKRIKHCVFIPLCKNPDKDKVFDFIQSGAHGVLVVPIQPEALKRVIETAFKAKESHITEKVPSREQLIEMANCLDLVASRIQSAAEQLKFSQADMGSSATNAKLLKESLLIAFADIGLSKEELANALVNLVKTSKGIKR